MLVVETSRHGSFCVEVVLAYDAGRNTLGHRQALDKLKADNQAGAQPHSIIASFANGSVEVV